MAASRSYYSIPAIASRSCRSCLPQYRLVEDVPPTMIAYPPTGPDRRGDSPASCGAARSQTRCVRASESMRASSLFDEPSVSSALHMADSVIIYCSPRPDRFAPDLTLSPRSFPAPTSLHHPPPHLPAQRILHQLVRATPLDESHLVHLAPRQRDEARCLRLLPEDAQLELGPVHLRRALGQGDMRDDRPAPHEQDDRHVTGRDLVPARARVGLAALVVDPFAGREVDAPRAGVVEQRRNQQVRAQQVFVLDQP